ncbi:hypothetical protein P5V15_003239 [Pogonomyrmex californicus]
MYDVQNKTVMITGAARGLGYKYAEILLRNGAKRVAMVDLPTSNGQDAAATLEKEFGKDRAAFYACDVIKAEDLERTFKEIVETFEGLDIIINNAGILDDKHWERMIEVNIKAVICGSLLAMDHMGKHSGGKGGVIVNIASIAGLVPCSFAPIYTATKHAVLGFSQALSHTYDETGVRVLIMCPGSTDTPMAKNFWDRTCELIYGLSEVRNEIGTLKCLKQSPDHVALAMLELIQKGENGVAWVSENGEPPYAIDFIHYSKRALPV